MRVVGYDLILCTAIACTENMMRGRGFCRWGPFVGYGEKGGDSTGAGLSSKADINVSSLLPVGHKKSRPTRELKRVVLHVRIGVACDLRIIYNWLKKEKILHLRALTQPPSTEGNAEARLIWAERYNSLDMQYLLQMHARLNC